MLKLYNKEHEAISALTNLKDYKIEYLLSGEDSLEFSLSICDEDIHLVEEEGYIRNKNNEYVIKAIDPSDNFKRFSCVVNIEDIKAKSIKSFDTSNNTIAETIRLAIAGTGWILSDNNITKRRTVRLKNTNALEVLREARKVFRVDFRFDVINKIIYVYEQFGEDRGVYFSDELNLRSLSIPSDTYDYATRIYPYGKDGLDIKSVNGGKEHIDNFQYSNKVIELIWEDNRYTDVNSLKSDAEAKLEELSKPKRSYQATISDLAKQNEEYSYLDFFIGDTITLLSKQEKFRDKQRIVKYIEYPNNPSQNTCELGNTTLTFEELQKENESKNQVVDNITSDNGTVDGSKVDNITTGQISNFEASVAKITDLTVINAKIENLTAQNVTITGKLTAVEGEFGTLKANVANIDKLVVNHTAEINNLIANSATITDLKVTNATIDNLEATVGKIQTLVNGNLSSENIQAGG
ncbi:MAG: phage tail protein, partial [Clostridium sp.]|uniref:phage tail protein n=1 Tax=Clostridium sp. TaxID=1506 RepID=UPI0030598973